MADQFLEAAIEPARWLDVLERVAQQTRSDHAQLIGVGPAFSIGFNWVNGFDASTHAAADRPELLSPQINYRVAAGVGRRAQMLCWEDHYDAIKPDLAGDAYLDLCSDLSIPFGCQANLLAGRDGLIGFALLRSHRNGPTNADTRAQFARLSVAAGAAVSLQAAFEQESCKLLAGTFEALHIACFVLDRDMRVRALSDAAQALLSDGTLRLVDGHVTATSLAVQNRLAAAGAMVMERRAAAANVVAADPSGMLTLKFHRLPDREWDMGYAPFAVLIAKRPTDVDSTALALLRDTYGLTTSEAEIAVMLRAGRTRAQICAARGITPETVRSHLRALFGKLGVRRETEAIHFLHALLS